MIIETFGTDEFPYTHDTIERHIGNVDRSDIGDGLSIFGGGARNGLIEAVLGIQRPIRDIDLLAVGNSVSDERYVELHRCLNPDDINDVKVIRHPDLRTLFEDDIDFTVNQTAITLGARPILSVSQHAISACMKRTIQVTEGEITKAVTLKDGGEATEKKYLRIRTNIPARAAYFVSTFRAAGIDFSYDLQDHPKPESPEQAHTFFLGLMARKALSVDEAERGPGDITATSLLIDLFREMKMTEATTPKTVEEVARFCHTVQEQHPHLRFYGSAVGNLIESTRTTEATP